MSLIVEPLTSLLSQDAATDPSETTATTTTGKPFHRRLSVQVSDLRPFATLVSHPDN
jgi:hypothetical protein